MTSAPGHPSELRPEGGSAQTLEDMATVPSPAPGCSHSSVLCHGHPALLANLPTEAMPSLELGGFAQHMPMPAAMLQDARQTEPQPKESSGGPGVMMTGKAVILTLAQRHTGRASRRGPEGWGSVSVPIQPTP